MDLQVLWLWLFTCQKRIFSWLKSHLSLSYLSPESSEGRVSRRSVFSRRYCLKRLLYEELFLGQTLREDELPLSFAVNPVLQETTSQVNRCPRLSRSLTLFGRWLLPVLAGDHPTVNCHCAEETPDAHLRPLNFSRLASTKFFNVFSWLGHCLCRKSLPLSNTNQLEHLSVWALLSTQSKHMCFADEMTLARRNSSLWWVRTIQHKFHSFWDPPPNSRNTQLSRENILNRISGATSVVLCSSCNPFRKKVICSWNKVFEIFLYPVMRMYKRLRQHANSKYVEIIGAWNLDWFGFNHWNFLAFGWSMMRTNKTFRIVFSWRRNQEDDEWFMQWWAGVSLPRWIELRNCSDELRSYSLKQLMC